MEVSRQHSFLVLWFSSTDSHHHIQMLPDLREVLADWQCSTRISPIFGIKEFGTEDPSRINFEGESSLFFIGPVYPLRVWEFCDPSNPIWITVGTYNVLIRATNDQVRSTIKDWATSNNVRHEVWSIKNGMLENSEIPNLENHDSSWRQIISALLDRPVRPELKDALREYGPLMSAAISRCDLSMPDLTTELLEAHKQIDQILVQPQPLEQESYERMGLMVNVNSGLSRYSSQAFSGTSPIIGTECHFYIHSLLGIGTANLALVRLFSFVREKLGEKRIPQLLECFATKQAPSPSLGTLDNLSDFWYQDHLSTITLKEEDVREPIFPMITYYSGRDGFKSTLVTLSAPLAAISSCNSLRWTLMTLTHELSHSIIRGVLTILYPDSDDDLESAIDLLERNPLNLLEDIRQYLLSEIILMQKVAEGTETNEEPRRIETEDLRSILDNWRHEIEEIFAHVFDFMYFYGRDAESYVKSIWMSWSVIPDVGNRIPEYIIRSLCALLVLHLRRGPESEVFAYEQLVRILEELHSSGHVAHCIAEALEYLKNHWEDEIRVRVFARKRLVRIVHTFIYSDGISADLRWETRIGGAATEREGYKKKFRYFDHVPIDNHLRFLDAYTRTVEPEFSDSLWMLYTLAFPDAK